MPLRYMSIAIGGGQCCVDIAGCKERAAARAKGAPPSAESAREPGCSQCTAATLCPEHSSDAAPKGEPAAEAPLTAEKVVGIVRMQGLNWDLTRDEAVEVVQRYARERSPELLKAACDANERPHGQLAAASAEIERLRVQLTQRPDARLREAAAALAGDYNADLLGHLERDGWDALVNHIRVLQSALAADPAPQVEREALPTLEQLHDGRALIGTTPFPNVPQPVRIALIERWIVARDNALTASGALAKEAGKTGGDHG
jgi:hypothetical protein